MAYSPRFTVTPALIGMMEDIAALRERIQAATAQLPWLPTLRADARVRNAHSSTAIEGNPLTLEEVRSLEEAKATRAADDRASREVLNQLAGLRFIERHAGQTRMTHEDVLSLHRLIGAGVMDQ